MNLNEVHHILIKIHFWSHLLQAVCNSRTGWFYFSRNGSQTAAQKTETVLPQLKKQKSRQIKNQRSEDSERETRPTFVFFSGLGGSSLLGGAVISFPVTAPAALVSSGFAGGKEKGDLLNCIIIFYIYIYLVYY